MNNTNDPDLSDIGQRFYTPQTTLNRTYAVEKSYGNSFQRILNMQRCSYEFRIVAQTHIIKFKGPREIWDSRSSVCDRGILFISTTFVPEAKEAFHQNLRNL